VLCAGRFFDHRNNTAYGNQCYNSHAVAAKYVGVTVYLNLIGVDLKISLFGFLCSSDLENSFAHKQGLDCRLRGFLF
jgi:hypothetical protein